MRTLRFLGAFMLVGMSILFLVSLYANHADTTNSPSVPRSISSISELRESFGNLQPRYFVSEQAKTRVHWAVLEYGFSEFDQKIRKLWDRPEDRKLLAIATVEEDSQKLQRFVFFGNRYESEIQLRLANVEIPSDKAKIPEDARNLFSKKLEVSIMDSTPSRWTLYMDDFSALYIQAEKLSELNAGEEKYSLFAAKPLAGVMLSGGEWMDVVFEGFHLREREQDSQNAVSSTFGFLSISYVPKRLALDQSKMEKIDLETFVNAMVIFQKKNLPLVPKDFLSLSQEDLRKKADSVSFDLSPAKWMELAQHFYGEVDQASVETSWSRSVSMTCGKAKTMHTPVSVGSDGMFKGYQWGYTKTMDGPYAVFFPYSFKLHAQELRMIAGTRGWPETVQLQPLHD